MIKPNPLALCLGLALASTALAQQPVTPTADVSYELGSKGENSFLKVEGKVPNLPNGTKIHVRLVEAISGVEGAFFVTPVTNERFQANRVFDQRNLAPLPYKVSIELILPDQRQTIKDYIRREWGLATGSRVILDTKDIDIGSDEEQAAFRVESIKTLLALTKEARKFVQELHTLFSSPGPKEKAAQEEQKREFGVRLRAQFVEPFDKFRLRYVVLQEQVTVDQLLSVITGFSRPLRDHYKGRSKRSKAKMDRYLSALTRIQEELESRLPKETPEKGDDSAGEGSAEGESK